MKLDAYKRDDGSVWGYGHYCPGCKHNHVFTLKTGPDDERHWTFDGNMEAPTFHPSMFVNRGEPDACHYFIKAGVIEYQNDCAHDLNAKHVPLPDLEEANAPEDKPGENADPFDGFKSQSELELAADLAKLRDETYTEARGKGATKEEAETAAADAIRAVVIADAKRRAIASGMTVEETASFGVVPKSAVAPAFDMKDHPGDVATDVAARGGFGRIPATDPSHHYHPLQGDMRPHPLQKVEFHPLQFPGEKPHG